MPRARTAKIPDDVDEKLEIRLKEKRCTYNAMVVHLLKMELEMQPKKPTAPIIKYKTMPEGFEGGRNAWLHYLGLLDPQELRVLSLLGKARREGKELRDLLPKPAGICVDELEFDEED